MAFIEPEVSSNTITFGSTGTHAPSRHALPPGHGTVTMAVPTLLQTSSCPSTHPMAALGSHTGA